MRVCAGGVLVRGRELLLARRADDRAFYPGVWDVVGGHCEPGESPRDALVREVEEEIGVRCALGDELSPIGYTDHKGRSKVVRYWLMEAIGDHVFEPNDEVDEVRWLKGRKALGRLSYPRDRDVLNQALEVLR